MFGLETAAKYERIAGALPPGNPPLRTSKHALVWPVRYVDGRLDLCIFSQVLRNEPAITQTQSLDQMVQKAVTHSREFALKVMIRRDVPLIGGIVPVSSL